jgi:hypothetical protein
MRRDEAPARRSGEGRYRGRKRERTSTTKGRYGFLQNGMKPFQAQDQQRVQRTVYMLVLQAYIPERSEDDPASQVNV